VLDELLVCVVTGVTSMRRQQVNNGGLLFWPTMYVKYNGHHHYKNIYLQGSIMNYVHASLVQAQSC